MTDLTWKELDPRAAGLAAARMSLHHAIQLVAAVGQSFAPRAKDDSQQSLTLAGAGAWLGVPVAGGTLRAGIDPLALELWLADGSGRPLVAFPLAGRSLAEGLHFLAAELGRRRVDGALELPRHPADFPVHALAKGAAFEGDDLSPRRELARLIANTQELLAATVGPSGPPLRLWPHHFDLACTVQVGHRSVGLGVSAGDGVAGRPYWYAAPWSALPGEGLPLLEGDGSWHVEGWAGAELPIGRLFPGARAQREQVGAFFRSVMAGPPRSAASRTA